MNDDDGNFVTSNQTDASSVSIPTYGLPPTAHSPRPLAAVRRHWPEYLIEAWALGMFMISAGVFATALEYPHSPLHAAIPNGDLRRVLIGLAMGATAIALIYSPWGQRSGAHMNPAVTLTYWRLGKIAPVDALCYMLAQFIGGTLGVLVLVFALGDAFAEAPVSYVATMPGSTGILVACIAEVCISAFLMFVILNVSNTHSIAKFTGLFAGSLVAIYISLEAPYSGMSMNPARSFASAFPGGLWQSFWIYLMAPVIGMQTGAYLYLRARGSAAVSCAKLLHPENQRCIHCGYEPKKG